MATQLAPWCKPGVKVELTHGQFTGQRATIDVPGPKCTISLDGGGGSIEVDVGELSALAPEVKGSVLVLTGEHGGLKGKVIGIDDDDIIVKMDQDDDLQVRVVLPLSTTRRFVALPTALPTLLSLSTDL